MWGKPKKSIRHLSRVAEPHHFNAVPDLAFIFNTDSDSTFHFNVDVDPDPDLCSTDLQCSILSLHAFIVSVYDFPRIHFEQAHEPMYRYLVGA